MKHVPESAPIIGAEEQLNSLREKLMGNQAFAVCRGKFNQTMMSTTDDLIKAVKSPSQFRRDLANFFGKATVMNNLLAQYERDGWTVAANELRKALQFSGHIILGETVPLQETEPITIFMFDPIKTMLLMKWIIEEHWMDLNKYLDWRDGEEKEPSLLTKQLFETFPTLEKHSRNRRSRGAYEGYDLESAYRDTVTNTFSKEGLAWLNNRELNRIIGKSLTVMGQYNDHLEIDQSFLYVFKGEQSKVLQEFTREEQKRIASWQFQAPKVLNWGSPWISREPLIGIHPAELHTKLKTRQPALTSKGVSHGLGAILITDNPLREQGHLYPTRTHSSSSVKPPYGVIFG